MITHREYVSRDLPYRQWFKTNVMLCLLNVAVGCWCLTVALTSNHGWVKVIIFVLGGFNFIVAIYMAYMGRRWLRKARLQEAGQVTYPHGL